MRSFGSGISPQTTVWESMREAARTIEARDLTRRALDDLEVAAIATRRAEARRARRQPTEAADHGVRATH